MSMFKEGEVKLLKDREKGVVMWAHVWGKKVTERGKVRDLREMRGRDIVWV